MTKILRIYLSNTDTLHHQSLYEIIAREAQNFGLQGATVLNGVMGFGPSSKLRSNKFWELNVKYPMVIELIDEESKLRNFLEKIKPELKDVHKGIVVTLHDVEIIFQTRGI